MNVHELIYINKEQILLQDVFLNTDSRRSIDQIIKEHYYYEELQRYNLPVNNKLLLHGSSGCGKTTTAKAIANALGKPLLILNLSNTVCARIGETSQNLKSVFDKAAREKTILFLDEFDHLGKARGNDDKDVGEMRRLVNTLIQLIDNYPANSLLICATNHYEIIDQALLRRFQVRIPYDLPSESELDGYYDALLTAIPEDVRSIQRRYKISFAEARDYAFTQIKANLIAKLENKANIVIHE